MTDIILEGVIDPIEKYCLSKGSVLAKKIDNSLAIILNYKPKYCPQWLYKKIVKDIVELVKIVDNNQISRNV